MTKHKSGGSCMRKKLIICFAIFSLLCSSVPAQAYSLREAVQNYSWREAVVDVGLEVVIGGTTKRFIARRLLARVASIAGKFVVKEIVFPDLGIGIRDTLTNARVGRVYIQEAVDCVERVECRVISISEVRNAGGRAKITVVGVSGVPGSLFNGKVFIDKPRGILACDPYVQVWEGSALIGNTIVGQDTTSARFGESFEVYFLKAERVRVVLKDQDAGRDDTLGEIQFSKSLPVGDELEFHMTCGATLTLAIHVVGETQHGRTPKETTISTHVGRKTARSARSAIGVASQGDTSPRDSRSRQNAPNRRRGAQVDATKKWQGHGNAPDKGRIGHFNREYKQVVSLIRQGRLEEADRLSLRLKEEIQEAKKETGG